MKLLTKAIMADNDVKTIINDLNILPESLDSKAAGNGFTIKAMRTKSVRTTAIWDGINDSFLTPGYKIPKIIPKITGISAVIDPPTR